MAGRVGIIGGGIGGMAIARALTMAGDFGVTVLEKKRRVATRQTGHNSGVVHAGLYCQPGSLRAVLCARGRNHTRDYCQEKGLPYRELGKLVVAVAEGELSRPDEIESRSRENLAAAQCAFPCRNLRPAIADHVLEHYLQVTRHALP